MFSFWKKYKEETEKKIKHQSEEIELLKSEIDSLEKCVSGLKKSLEKCENEINRSNIPGELKNIWKKISDMDDVYSTAIHELKNK